MARVLLQVILLCGIAVISGQRNYCNLQSCRGKAHTMCSYPNPGASTYCSQTGRRGLNQAEKNAILNAHNRLRAKVASGQERRGAPGPQPAATNLRPLTWNNEIADIAQRWADQCNYKHDQCRDTANGMYVGQNIAYIGWSDGYHEDSILQMVDNWYNEVADFDRRLVKALYLPPEPPKLGHYTQMVWAQTTMLGCGAMRFKQPGEYYKTYLVCNYGPGGNYPGQPVYNSR